MLSEIFGTNWKSPKRWLILGATFFLLVFFGMCFLISRATESVINHDDQSPLAIVFSSDVLQAAFDKEKQSHLLTAEFKIVEAEKAERDHDYKTAHKAFADAIDELPAALGKGSHFTRLMMLRAGVLESDFHHAKLAQGYFEHAIEEPVSVSTPKSFLILARRYLARSLDSQKLYDQEVECYEKAVELAKSKPGEDENDLIGTVTELGSAQVHVDTDAALKSFNQAVSIIQKQKRVHKNDQRDASVYFWRGYCLLTLQKNAEAVADFSRAVAFDKDDFRSLSYRGCALMSLGRYQEAVSDFDRALKAKDKPAWLYSRRDKALSSLKKQQQSSN